MLKQLHVDLQAFLLLAPVKRSLFAQPNLYFMNQVSFYPYISQIEVKIKSLNEVTT